MRDDEALALSQLYCAMTNRLNALAQRLEHETTRPRGWRWRSDDPASREFDARHRELDRLVNDADNRERHALQNWYRLRRARQEPCAEPEGRAGNVAPKPVTRG